MAGHFKLAYANIIPRELSEMVNRVPLGESTEHLSSGRGLYYSDVETRNRYIDNA